MIKINDLRSGLNVFVSFFLSFLITLVFLSVALLLGGLNINVIDNDLKKTNYYESGYDEFIQQASNIAQHYGLSDIVVSDTITMANYHSKANNYMKVALKNKDTNAIDIAIDMELENVVRAWTEEVIKSRGNVTISENQTIEQCAINIAKIYKDSIKFSFIKDIAVQKEKIVSTIKQVLPVVLIGITLIMITLLVTNKYKHRAVRYIVYAVIGADITTLVFGMYLFKIKGQLIETDHKRYQVFLDYYYRDSLVPFFLVSGVGVLIAVFLLLIIRQMRNQLIKKHSTMN